MDLKDLFAAQRAHGSYRARSRQDKCFSRMGLPQLTPEEMAAMTANLFTTFPAVRVAIDMAKLTHHVLLELPLADVA